MASKNVSRKITISINGKEVEDSLSGIGKEIGRLNKELRKTTDPEERKRLNNELKATKQRYKEINDEVRETPSLLNQIKTQLGPVATGMLGVFSVAAVFKFGEQIIDTIKLFRELKHETKTLTDLNGEFLDNAVSGTKALSDTFETDYKENLTAANALVKTFNVTYQEALEVMEKGYLAGANVSGDMLNQIKEYAPLMKEANLELDEMVALITQTTKEGLFNDKGIDTIKEGMLRIREGTKATQEALTGLGIDTKKVYEDLAAGNTNYFKVMQLVSTKLNELEEQSPAVGTAIADIFGGPGEDAGLEYLQSLKDINLELESLIDPTDEYNILKAEEVRINRELNEVWVELTETGGALNQVYLYGKDLLAGWLTNISDTAKASDRLSKVLGKGFWTDGLLKPGNYKELANLSLSLSEMRKNAVTAKDPLRAIAETIIGLNASIAAEDASTQGGKDRIALYKDELKQLSKAAEDFNNQETAKQKETIIKKEQQEKEAAERKSERDKAAYQKAAEKEAELESKKAEALKVKEQQEEERKAAKIIESKKKLADLIAAFDEEQALQKELLKYEEDQMAEEEEVLRLEQKYADLTEQAFNDKELEKQLEEQKAIELQAVRDKHAKIWLDKNAEDLKKLAEQDKQYKEEVAHAELELQMAKEDALMDGIGILKNLAKEGTSIYKALFAVEKIMAATQVLLDGQKERAAYAANPFWSAMPDGGALIKAKMILASKIRTGISLATIAATAIKGFDKGGFTTGLGFTDHSGHQVAGVVHADEYVVPKFIAQDPVYADTIGFLEQKRIQGLGKGYADGGTVEPVNTNSSNDQLVETLRRLSGQLENGIYATALIGDDEIVKQKARENKLVQTRESAKIS